MGQRIHDLKNSIWWQLRVRVSSQWCKEAVVPVDRHYASQVSTESVAWCPFLGLPNESWTLVGIMAHQMIIVLIRTGEVCSSAGALVHFTKSLNWIKNQDVQRPARELDGISKSGSTTQKLEILSAKRIYKLITACSRGSATH
jgi:hypothetical protein